MNLLIIGGAGYIGSHMVKRPLASNIQTILDNLSTGYRDAVLGGEFIQGDIANRLRNLICIIKIISPIPKIY
jgi:UDP-glucose 4-epimerase